MKLYHTLFFIITICILNNFVATSQEIKSKVRISVNNSSSYFKADLYPSDQFNVSHTTKGKLGFSGGYIFEFNFKKRTILDIGVELSLQRFNNNSEYLFQYSEYDSITGNRNILYNEIIDENQDLSVLYLKIPVLVGFKLFKNKLKCKAGFNPIIKVVDINPVSYSEFSFNSLNWATDIELSYSLFKNMEIYVNYSNILNSVVDIIYFTSLDRMYNEVYSIGFMLNFSNGVQ